MPLEPIAFKRGLLQFDTEVDFGKYSGSLFQEIVQKDRKYAEWLFLVWGGPIDMDIYRAMYPANRPPDLRDKLKSLDGMSNEDIEVFIDILNLNTHTTNVLYNKLGEPASWQYLQNNHKVDARRKSLYLELGILYTIDSCFNELIIVRPSLTGRVNYKII